MGLAPVFAGSLLGRYEFPVGAGLQLALQANVDHTGNHYASADNLPANRQSYTLLGARVTLRHAQGWELAAFGRNLSNEIYITNVGFAGNDFQISMPRAWGVEARYRFN